MTFISRFGNLVVDDEPVYKSELYDNPSINLNSIITSSVEWSRNILPPVALNDGEIANGFTFFDDVLNKVANGTTSYNNLNISYGITITLTGLGGSANINVNGVDYLATFDTDLFTTASDWVLTNQATLKALGINVFEFGSGSDGRIRFGSLNKTILNNITITTASPNLSGTIANEFTGSPTASYDHLVIPYVGQPYEGLRITHKIRANFNLSVGSVQYAQVGLFRYQNDTQIGSGILVLRNPDVTGNLITIHTYTADASDPFVTGGFYIALINNTGQTLGFFGNAGILIQSIFEKPVNFS